MTQKRKRYDRHFKIAVAQVTLSDDMIARELLRRTQDQGLDPGQEGSGIRVHR